MNRKMPQWRDMAGTRAALVELVNSDPFHRYPVDLFPFLQGLPDLLPLEVRWLRLFVDATPDCLNPSLTSADRDCLIAALDGLRPTHIYWNVQPEPSALSIMNSIEPRPSVLVAVSAHSIYNVGSMWTAIEWLGLTDEFRRSRPNCRNPVDAITPSYNCVNLNENKDKREIINEIHTGPICAFRKPLSENPFYAGMPGFDSWTGCSFCSATSYGKRPFDTPPMKLALRQLKAMNKTGTKGTDLPAFDFFSAHMFLRIERLFQHIHEMDFPPGRFLFTCRIDEFLRKADALEAMLPAISAHGHMVSLHRIGVENFSPMENERLNKGITQEAFANAFERIRDLESKWPDTFSFNKYGGFGFITFTPWTTLEDIEINLAAARKYRISPRSHFLESRLQLQPDRPVTKRAIRDGLVLPSKELDSFYSGCIRYWDEDEVQWRFQHEKTAMFHALAGRLRTAFDEPVEEDRFKEPVRYLLLHVPMDHLSGFRVAELLLEAIRKDTSCDPAALISTSLALAWKDEEASDCSDALPPRFSASGLARALGKLSVRQPDYLDGYSPVSVLVNVPETKIALCGPNGRLTLRLAPLEEEVQCFATTARYRLSFSMEPVSSETEASEVVRRIGCVLDACPSPKSERA